jgi:hypothetical protein
MTYVLVFLAVALIITIFVSKLWKPKKPLQNINTEPLTKLPTLEKNLDQLKKEIFETISEAEAAELANLKAEIISATLNHKL